MKLCLVTLLLLVVTLSAFAKRDPRELLRECKKQCEGYEGSRTQDQKKECEQKCDEYFRERRSREGDDIRRWEGKEEEEREENPYLFEERHFETVVRSEEGRVHVLKRFNERSELLKGIKNYRIGYIEANPRAFIAPAHFDADTIFFVAKGRATVTLLRKEKKSYNLESGDVLFIPAGTPVYAVNRDDNQKLFIVKFFNPVSLPGRFEPFYVAGGEDRETLYKAFSWEVLRAALKNKKEDIERFFGQEKRGRITKASKEQIEEISRHAQSAGEGEGIAPVWPFHGDSEEETSFNIFKYSVHSNRYGRLFQSKFDKFKQLKQLELVISLANITRGNLMGPLFNSKATKIAFVVDGIGFFEMACPHISTSGQQEEQQQQQQPQRQTVQRVTGQLKPGTVFVAPAGHPIAIVASPNSNLQVLCFEVFAKDNHKYTLAGKNNLVTKMDHAAAELSFNTAFKEVQKIFGGQDEDIFFAGPTSQERRAPI